MASIIKLYREKLPACVLIGKTYHDGDQNQTGNFSGQWEEWFRNGWFKTLEQTGKTVSDAYFGAMRMNGGVFEYWIGMLLDPAAEVPEGFSAERIPGGMFGTAWIKGTNGPELYGACEECEAAFAREGWQVPDNAWHFERYVCPRFTTPDENGEIILDYLASLKD